MIIRKKPKLSGNVFIGDDVIVHDTAWIGDLVQIGKGSKIQPFAFIPNFVVIGNNCFVGPHVCFTNDKYPPSGGRGWASTQVKDGAVIGANATILPGIIIGKNAVVGAGSVVTKDVEPNSTVAGNPAKPIG